MKFFKGLTLAMLNGCFLVNDGKYTHPEILRAVTPRKLTKQRAGVDGKPVYYSVEVPNLDAQKWFLECIEMFADRVHLQKSQVMMLMKRSGSASDAHKFYKNAAEVVKRLPSHTRTARQGEIISLAMSDTVVVEGWLKGEWRHVQLMRTQKQLNNDVSAHPLMDKNKGMKVPRPLNKIDSAIRAMRSAAEAKKRAAQSNLANFGISGVDIDAYAESEV